MVAPMPDAAPATAETGAVNTFPSVSLRSSSGCPIVYRSTGLPVKTFVTVFATTPVACAGFATKTRAFVSASGPAFLAAFTANTTGFRFATALRNDMHPAQATRACATRQSRASAPDAGAKAYAVARYSRFAQKFDLAREETWGFPSVPPGSETRSYALETALAAVFGRTAGSIWAVVPLFFVSGPCPAKQPRTSGLGTTRQL